MTQKDGAATAQWLFDLLDAQVKRLTGQAFELDAAAARWNAKCADYFDEELDALAQDWSRWNTIFCNPPFSAALIAHFVRKAIEAAQSGSTVVLLLPAWRGYPWFQDVTRLGQLRDIIGPVEFERPDGTRFVLNNGARSTSLVVATLGPHITPGSNGEPIRRPGGGEPHAGGRTMPFPGRRNNRQASPFVLLSEVEPQPVEYLWSPYVPRGELTVLDGDPGTNKTSLALTLAAAVSTGRPLPGGTGHDPAGVVLLSAEDSVHKTLPLRLEAAGADLTRVAALGEAVSFPADLGLLEEVACRTAAKLLVIDPLMAFLAPDAHADQKVRRALTPLRALAERHDLAVVLVRHLNKGGSRQALYRGSGSIAIVGATRSALLVGTDPEDPHMRVVCHVKSNLAPKGPSLLFEPVAGANGAVRVEWRGECAYGPDDLLGPPRGRPPRKLDEAKALLLEVLSEGPAEQQALMARAAQAGIAWRTVERAKEDLGVVSAREGFGAGGKWLWQLPAAGDRP
jgi:DNA repair protein RadA/Sms